MDYPRITVRSIFQKNRRMEVIILNQDEDSPLIILNALQSMQTAGYSISIDKSHDPSPANLPSLNNTVPEKVTDLLEQHYKNGGTRFQNFTPKSFNEPIAYILVFRDPVAQGLASILKTIETHSPNSFDDGQIEETQLGDLRKLFYTELIKKKQKFNLLYHLDLKSHFKLDLVDITFDQEKGFGITQTVFGNILLLKHETLPKNCIEAIHELLEIDHSILRKTKIEQNPSSSSRYDLIKKYFKLPNSLLDHIYNQPEIKAFYTDIEIDNFKTLWQANHDQQAYQEYWRLQLAKAQFTIPINHNDFSKLILVAGLPRSGSTLLFNIALHLLEKSTTFINLGYIDSHEVKQFLELYEEYPVCALIKVHDLNVSFLKYINAGAPVIFSFRDLRDSSVSAIHKGFIENDDLKITNFIRSCMRMSQFWEPSNNLMRAKYEEMAFNVPELVQNIAAFLQINLPAEEVKKIANSVDYKAAVESSKHPVKVVKENNGEKVYDAQTLLHKDHLAGGETGKYLKVFSKDQIENIEKVCYHWLISHGYKPTVYQPDSSRYYFSEYGEDFVIWTFFNFKEEGFFVDIGSFDGLYLSKTYSLELGGWKGICIEANPEVAQQLNINRPSSINISSVIVENIQQEKVNFYCDPSGLFSSLSKDSNPLPFDPNWNLPRSNKKKKKLLTDTLNNVLTTHAPKQKTIDVITISVVGTELRVLKGLDLNKFQPRLLLINSDKSTTKSLQTYMTVHGYTLAITLGKTLFFTKRQNDIKKLRGIAVNCFIEKQIHPMGLQYSHKGISQGIQYVNGNVVSHLTQEPGNKKQPGRKTHQQNLQSIQQQVRKGENKKSGSQGIFNKLYMRTHGIFKSWYPKK